MAVLSIPDACRDLSLLRPEDGDRFQAALDQCRIKSHHYYFPRLLFSGQRRSRLLLFEEAEGSILLYSLNQGTLRLHLGLYVPPFPFSVAALRRARERMRDFNGGRAGRISWVQDEDAGLVAAQGFSLDLREREFIYDRAAVQALEGPAFSRLRRYLAGVRKYEGLTARRFTSADQDACLALYRKFRAQLLAKGVEIKGQADMANCLKGATQLPESRLRGEVFEIDGTVCAYSFGGPINPDCGCVFVTTADHDYPGLAYALRYNMMKSFPDLTYFNDTTDNRRAGLAEMKQRFRPTEMHRIFAARETA